MAIFDYFVYVNYISLVNKWGRTHDEALFSAVGMLAVYTTFFIWGIIGFIGIIKDNPTSEMIVNAGPVFVLPFGIINFALWSIRYYKVVDDINLKIEMREQHKSGKNMRRLVTFILIAVPIFSFVAFRIYLGDWNDKF